MPYKDPDQKKAHNKAYYLTKVKSGRESDGSRKKASDQTYRDSHGAQLNAQAKFKRANGHYAKYDRSRTPRPLYSKEWFLKSKYGITLERWMELFESQGSRCGACGSSTALRGRSGSWATDHCHDTGEVRGILCHACNLALGWMGDTAKAVEENAGRLLAYLAGVAIRRSCNDLNGIQTAAHKAKPLIHHAVVRADLPIGSQVANILHAGGESASPRPTPGCIAVALHARDEAHLKEIAQRLFDAGIEHHCVFESDDDVKYPGQMMAIGLYPTRDRDKVRKVLSSLPLVR